MYSQTAESFSLTNDREGFLRVFSEIADITPTKDDFRIRDLIGKLPSVKRYADKTQAEIARVIIRDSQTLPDNHDRILKSRRTGFKWSYAERI